MIDFPALLEWQTPLGKNREQSEKHRRKGDHSRRIAAELKRVRRPEDAAFQEGFHQLMRLIPTQNRDQIHALEVLALLAPRVAHTAGLHLPRALAGIDDGKVMSPLRFRRIVETIARRELFLPLMRALRLVDGKADFMHLTRSLLFWDEDRRRDWARDYYEHYEDKKKTKE